MPATYAPRWCRALVPAFALLALGGCISTAIAETPPDFATLMALRAHLHHPVATGPIELADPKLGNAVNIRGSTLHPPQGKTFATVLKDSLDSQLRAAGMLDPAATTRLTGTLSNSNAGENMAHGHAVLAADITIIRAGAPVFSHHYEVVSTWDSNFIGAIAISDAFIEYNALYSQLSRKILDDPALISAINGD